MLVEDEARIAQFVAKGLEASGLDVTVAEDGDVGAFLAATEPYDLVLLDLGLPGTPGLEILRLMRHAEVAGGAGAGGAGIGGAGTWTGGTRLVAT